MMVVWTRIRLAQRRFQSYRHPSSSMNVVAGHGVRRCEFRSDRDNFLFWLEVARDLFLFLFCSVQEGSCV